MALAAGLAFLSGADFRPSPKLRLGIACHAFEHLGDIHHQADAAAACGATVIYAGFGGAGYSGLPEPDAFAKLLADEAAYVHRAGKMGIETVLGYVCATSIVGLLLIEPPAPSASVPTLMVVAPV